MFDVDGCIHELDDMFDAQVLAWGPTEEKRAGVVCDDGEVDIASEHLTQRLAR